MSYLHPMYLSFQRCRGRDKEVVNQYNPILIKVYSNKENSGHKWVDYRVYQTFKEEILGILNKFFCKMKRRKHFITNFMRLALS